MWGGGPAARDDRDKLVPRWSVYLCPKRSFDHGKNQVDAYGWFYYWHIFFRIYRAWCKTAEIPDEIWPSGVTARDVQRGPTTTLTPANVAVSWLAGCAGWLQWVVPLHCALLPSDMLRVGAFGPEKILPNPPTEKSIRGKKKKKRNWDIRDYPG